MQLGLYTTRANRSCGGYAGSCGHEFVDVQQWAEWGVTYMKDDSCGSSLALAGGTGNDRVS